MVSKEEMLKFVMNCVNGNSEPDAMAEALTRIDLILHNRMRPYTVMLMDPDDADWSPWLAIGEGREDAIEHAREQWRRAYADEGAPAARPDVIKVYRDWIGHIVAEGETYDTPVEV